jgi:hypothetical protein
MKAIELSNFEGIRVHCSSFRLSLVKAFAILDRLASRRGRDLCPLSLKSAKSVSFAEFAENEITVLSRGVAGRTGCLSLGS